MTINSARAVEFRSIKQLVNRMNANRDNERTVLISAEDFDVPSWQRQIVWTPEDMGLLAYSIVQNYPIGMVVLWRKDDGVRVPIDGRQRLTAIRQFYLGHVAIPDLPGIDEELRNTKFRLYEGDEGAGFKQLSMRHREVFEDYEPSIIEYENIDEITAMDIFVKLQGGKSLNKTEVRAALGGRLCDFVTELTEGTASVGTDDSDEEDVPLGHEFFKGINVRNVRKAHRNLCDVLLHEELYSGKDKHWSSLETMYRDKASTLTEEEKRRFRSSLTRFQRSVEVEEQDRKVLLPQLRSTFLILTFYQVWREITSSFVLPPSFSYSSVIRAFETQRVENSDQYPWVNFSAALSNAGYAQGRLRQRYDILMSFVLRRFPDLVLRSTGPRLFAEEQKIAIWDRADRQCEWVEDGRRCEKRFANFRDADADHFIRWIEGGETTVENGRLLCQTHNRGRR